MMMRTPALLVVTALSAGALGYGLAEFRSASSAPPDGRVIHGVAYYQAHGQLQEKLAACKDNPGGALADGECQNAWEALHGAARLFPPYKVPPQ